jgi:hypothetical protein
VFISVSSSSGFRGLFCGDFFADSRGTRFALPMRDALVIGFDLPNSRGVDDALAKPAFVALRELSPLVRPPPPVNPDVNLLSMDVMAP